MSCYMDLDSTFHMVDLDPKLHQQVKSDREFQYLVLNL